jgi:hypothetical protein
LLQSVGVEGEKQRQNAEEEFLRFFVTNATVAPERNAPAWHLTVETSENLTRHRKFKHHRMKSECVTYSETNSIHVRLSEMIG